MSAGRRRAGRVSVAALLAACLVVASSSIARAEDAAVVSLLGEPTICEFYTIDPVLALESLRGPRGSLGQLLTGLRELVVAYDGCRISQSFIDDRRDGPVWAMRELLEPGKGMSDDMAGFAPTYAIVTEGSQVQTTWLLDFSSNDVLALSAGEPSRHFRVGARAGVVRQRFRLKLFVRVEHEDVVFAALRVDDRTASILHSPDKFVVHSIRADRAWPHNWPLAEGRTPLADVLAHLRNDAAVGSVALDLPTAREKWGRELRRELARPAPWRYMFWEPYFAIEAHRGEDSIVVVLCFQGGTTQLFKSWVREPVGGERFTGTDEFRKVLARLLTIRGIHVGPVVPREEDE